MEEGMTLEVRCNKDVKGGDIPRDIFIDGRQITVLRVVDQWLAFDHRYFKIYGDDGALYMLRYEVGTDSWEMTFLEQLRNLEGC
jgi:hypothetical protein